MLNHLLKNLGVVASVLKVTSDMLNTHMLNLRLRYLQHK